MLLDGGQNGIIGGAGQDVLEMQTVIVQETDAEGRVIREVTSDFDIIEENGTLTVLHYAARGGVLTELGRAEFGADVETICIFDPIPSDQAATQGFDSRDRRVAQDIDVATLPNDDKTEVQDVIAVLPADEAAPEAPADDGIRFSVNPTAISAEGHTVGSYLQTAPLSDGAVVVVYLDETAGNRLMGQRLTPSGQHQFGGSGDEVLTATNKASYLVGGSGHDPLEGGAGSDLLIGGDHDDDLLGGRGADLLDGGSGRDLREGGKGNDTLTGGRGADRLEGGEGDDILTGGADADQFIFATDQVRLINGSTETLEVALSFGHDVIPDFDTRRARIDLRLVSEVDSSDDLVFVQEGGNVRILIADSSITLEGQHSTDLAANDLLF